MKLKIKWDSQAVRIGISIFLTALLVAGGIKLLPGTISVNSTAGGKELPINSVKTTEKQIALTFEVGRGEGQVAEILQVLESCDVKATFFVTGSWIAEHPDEVVRISEAGHELGNASETYQSMSQLSKKVE